ncbi:MAG: EAL domain-containing protein [Methyloprofundus sp.]|nr:EAL domain-containing protein [Methyloprofundus sp.]
MNRNVLIGNILLVLCYFIAGQLTLTLSLSLGGATSLWAPTGIALGAVLIWGYRLLPGVFLGDFLVAVGLMGLDDHTAIALCFIIGGQAMFHAWLGKYLLVKFKLWPTLLVHDRDILKFFLIAGVVASFFSALLVVAADLLLGVLKVDTWLDSLVVWWVGGALGVVVFTPVTLILFARPKLSWRNRVVTVAVPMVILFLALLFVLQYARKNEERQVLNRFAANAEITHTLIKGELEKHETLLRSMAANFQNNKQLNQQYFDHYLTEFSEYQEDIYAVAWAQYLPDESRADYEQQYGEILELNSQGLVVRAAKRAGYFVIKYSQVPSEYFSAYEELSSVNNFDLCFGADRAALCEYMQRTKTSIILWPKLESLLLYPEQRFIYVLPVIAEHKVVGLVANMYSYEHLFGQLLNSFDQQWLELEIIDITAEPAKSLFNSVKNKNSLEVVAYQNLLVNKIVDVGGRQWQFSYRPSPEFIGHYASWLFYWLITASFFVLSLIGAFLLNIAGREQRIQNEVEEKTKKISKQAVLLEDSERKFRRLVEGVRNDYIIYTHDVEGVFTYVSPSIETILGYTPEEFLVHYTTYLPDTELNQLAQSFTDRAIQGEAPPSYELEILHKNGSLHTLRITEAPLFDAQGKVIAVEGISQDITILKAARLEMEKLSLVVTHSPNGVIITNKEGIVEYVNPKFNEITGYSSDEIKGKSPSMVSSGHTPINVYKDLWDTLLAGNEWRGELQNRKKNGELFWVSEHICPMFDESGNITHFVAIQEDITDAKRLREETNYQASHDLLTGLVNRREFEVRLKRVVDSAKRERDAHALCFLDLDQFKVVNDTCGHVAGDELLRQVGSLMQDNIRSRDTLARLGGDEFAILMEHCGIVQANQAAEHVIRAMENFRFHWEEHTFAIGVSIGLAIIDQHTKDSQEILSQVDSACYAAKDAGRNRVEVHTENSERLRQRKGEIKWSSEISDALDNDRFLLYVQPIVPVLNKNLNIGYEVLLRLKMQDGTIVPPGAFLPAAERYNSATRIDRWVIHHTLQWLSRHADQLQQVRSIAINLSGQSLGDETVLNYIIDQFESGDVPAEKIKFEITETAAIANLQDATLFMKTLSKFGCQFALDDFGSGLSSFAYLKNLNVDVLKIDGMFVKDMLDDPIDHEMVKSINQIGHVMGLETIAEFVENNQILEQLRTIGVDYAQGYYLGKPVPIDSILNNNKN